jgi:uncharacterized protein (DUF697 family)
MTGKKQENSWDEQLNRAIAELVAAGMTASEAAEKAFLVASDEFVGVTVDMGHTVSKQAQEWAEQGTETVGRAVTPIAENPFIKYAAKVPGINWLLAALGQVDVNKAQAEIETLRQENPFETTEQLAHRIMVDTALKAGTVGLVTNIVPPIALMLFAVDIAAVTALQAAMVYRIAGLYGFPLNDPARRGEVLAIFGLSLGGSGAVKLGLSFVELLPGLGPIVGATSDAALIYALGHIACRFYEAKRKPSI